MHFIKPPNPTNLALLLCNKELLLRILKHIFRVSGILNDDGSINNPASIKRIAEISLSYAKAGMDI